MPKEASLRIFKADVELLTERKDLNMIEPVVRGAVTSAFDSRCFSAINSNNPATLALRNLLLVSASTQIASLVAQRNW